MLVYFLLWIGSGPTEPVVNVSFDIGLSICHQCGWFINTGQGTGLSSPGNIKLLNRYGPSLCIIFNSKKITLVLYNFNFSVYTYILYHAAVCLFYGYHAGCKQFDTNGL